MKNKLFATVLSLLLVSSVSAKVDIDSIPATAAEETVMTVKGKSLSSGANPLAASVLTADGVSITLPVNPINNKKGEIFLPAMPDSISGLVYLTLRISGGNVPSSSPETFVLLLAKRTANAPSDLDPGTVASLPELPESTSDGIGVTGATGPQGPQGEPGLTGPTGPQGPIGLTPTSLPGANVVGPVASASQAIDSTQTSITTLPALISAGTVSTTTTFLSTVNGSAGFRGNLTGNVTGNVTGNADSATTATTAGDFTGSLSGDVTGTQSATVIADSVVTGKALLNNYSASAGTVANGDSVYVAIQKLDGNIAANTSDIATLNTTVNAATAANTADTIVKRDANGDFAASNITATTFTGNLVGNVTGNADSATSATTAGDFTGSLSGDVTGTQSATVIADSVVTGKALLDNYSASAGTVANGDSVYVAIQKLDGNIAANTSDIATLNTTVNAATAANTADTIVKRDANGDFAASNITATTFTGNLVGNVTGNADSATSATTATSFTGSLSGDVTGTQSATVIADSVVTGKALLDNYSASAGTVANGDSVYVAIQKLDGNIAANTSDIATLNTTVNAATAANTADTIVKRDANGDFAASNITATTFTGNLVGNVTGNADSATSATMAGDFTGSLSGDVTGTQSATVIADSVVTGKALLDNYSASAGTVVNGDSLYVAVQKLDGNIAANTTAIATNTSDIATLNTTVNAATAANTADTIVKRDANGDFAANVITATTFVGNLTGTVSNATTAGSATNFTGSLSGDVTGTQSATVIADSVVTGKALLNNYSASAGLVENGDSIYEAIQNLDGNVQANATAIATLNTTVNAATAANTADALVKRDANGDFAANVITATTFVGNLTGTVSNATTAGSATNFTGSLSGDVAGTQSATVIADSVVTGKALLDNYSASAGLVENGDSIYEAIQNLDGNIAANTTAIATNTSNIAANTTLLNTINGKVAANTTLLTAVNGQVAMNTFDIADIAANGVDKAKMLQNGTTLVTVGGGDNVALVSNGNITLTLPAANGTLATTTGLTPFAIAAADFDIEGQTTYNATGVNTVVFTDSSTSGSPEPDIIGTITGGFKGQTLTIIFTASTRFTDTNAGTANSLNLKGGNGTETLAAGDVLILIYNGTYWLEHSRSEN